MALEVDGFSILRTIGVHPHIFKAIAKDAAKAARTLVTKQIAHRNTGLKTVRDIRAAVGPEAFSLIMDGMTPAQIKSLVTRLDKHGAPDKLAEGVERQHVLALADGSAQPTEPPPDGAVKKAPRPKKAPKPPARLHYESAGATRKR
jgi:hypothetical protein